MYASFLSSTLKSNNISVVAYHQNDLKDNIVLSSHYIISVKNIVFQKCVGVNYGIMVR